MEKIPMTNEKSEIIITDAIFNDNAKECLRGKKGKYSHVEFETRNSFTYCRCINGHLRHNYTA